MKGRAQVPFKTGKSSKGRTHARAYPSIASRQHGQDVTPHRHRVRQGRGARACRRAPSRAGQTNRSRVPPRCLRSNGDSRSKDWPCTVAGLACRVIQLRVRRLPSWDSTKSRRVPARTALSNGGTEWARYWQLAIIELRDRVVGKGKLGYQLVEAFWRAARLGADPSVRPGWRRVAASRRRCLMRPGDVHRLPVPAEGQLALPVPLPHLSS